MRSSVTAPDEQAALDGARQRREIGFYNWILKHLVERTTPANALSTPDETKRIQRLCGQAARLAVAMWRVDQHNASLDAGAA